MSSDVKTLSVDSAHFNMQYNTKPTRKRQAKTSSGKPGKSFLGNILKKKLLDKIRSKEKEAEEADEDLGFEDSEEAKDDAFQKELQESIEFLQQLAKDKEKQKLQRKTLRWAHSTQQPPASSSSSPPSTSFAVVEFPNSPPLTTTTTTASSLQLQSLQPLGSSFPVLQLQPTNQSLSSPSQPHPPFAHALRPRKRILKKRHVVGKHKELKQVGVLVRDLKTRKRANEQLFAVRQKPMEDVRIYLRKKHLVGAGSSAPNTILRQLYEHSLSLGGLENKNVKTWGKELEEDWSRVET